MTFNIIKLENWDRKEYFEHYFNQQTTYSITKEIDITLFKDMIKKKGYENLSFFDLCNYGSCK